MEGLNIDVVPTLHSEATPFLDPSRTKLSPGFSVLIIGASRGIGAHVAHAYALAGASTLALAARTTTGLVETAAVCQRLSPGISVFLERCDIASADAMAAMAVSVERVTGGRLDVVINNSGYAGPMVTSFTEGQATDDFHQCFEVNTMGVYHTAHHFIPLLLKTEGGAKCLVVVGAAAAWITDGPIASMAYCVSKLAQLRLVEMMANQYGKDGLLSVVVHPGAVATEMAKVAPKEFVPYLTDSVDLCGAFCVWLTGNAKSLSWLNGRYLSAKWDIDELLERREDIVKGDLLKASMKI
ncbi:MAG: hypothetical protein Q9174_003157 [Haloplaca sp. 1 TL-2023]